jgi:hypothetical protein
MVVSWFVYLLLCCYALQNATDVELYGVLLNSAIIYSSSFRFRRRLCCLISFKLNTSSFFKDCYHHLFFYLCLIISLI